MNNYFLQPSYWCGTKQHEPVIDHRGSKVGVAADKKGQSEFFESEPVNLEAGIQIKSLTKMFKGKAGKKVRHYPGLHVPLQAL